MLKHKGAYMMSQAINYSKHVKCAHINVTTFMLHYCERWIMNFILRQKAITWHKSDTFQEWCFSPIFRCFSKN